MSTDQRSLEPAAEGLSTMSRWQRRQLSGWGSRRSRLGPAAGMLGGALVVIGTFLPWLEFNGRVRSGWEIYDLYSTAGTNPAVISPMFGAGDYDVFFTGLVTLPLGILSVLLTAAVLLANSRPPPAKVRARAVLMASAALAIVAALAITAVNIRTARMGTLGFEQSPVHYGLWAMFAGGLAGTTGLAASITGKRHRAPQRVQRATVVAPAPESPVSDSQVAHGLESEGLDSGSEQPEGPVSEGLVSAPPEASRSTSTARKPARTFAILLLVVGLGGYATAAVADNSVASTAAADEAALGRQDPVVAAAALRAGVTPVKDVFDTYAAASREVFAARGDVNRLFNQERAQSASGRLAVARARGNLNKGIAAYGVAVERERAARKAYADQLALLMAEVHR